MDPRMNRRGKVGRNQEGEEPLNGMEPRIIVESAGKELLLMDPYTHRPPGGQRDGLPGEGRRKEGG